MNCTFKAESVILFGLLLVCLTGAGRATNSIDNSNQSELEVTLLDYGPVGDHGWTFEGQRAQPEWQKICHM